MSKFNYRVACSDDVSPEYPGRLKSKIDEIANKAGFTKYNSFIYSNYWVTPISKKAFKKIIPFDSDGLFNFSGVGDIKMPNGETESVRVFKETFYPEGQIYLRSASTSEAVGFLTDALKFFGVNTVKELINQIKKETK